MTAPNSDLHIVCAYTGVPGDCSECGGWDPTHSGFCGDDCRDARLDREERHRAEAQARRDADDAFGREADRLRAAGHTDVEVDELLEGMP